MDSATTGSSTSWSSPIARTPTLFRNARSISVVMKASPMGPTSVSSLTTCAGALYIFSVSRLTNIENISPRRRLSWLSSELVYSLSLLATPPVPMIPPSSANSGTRRILLSAICPSGMPFLRSLQSPS